MLNVLENNTNALYWFILDFQEYIFEYPYFNIKHSAPLATYEAPRDTNTRHNTDTDTSTLVVTWKNE